MFPELPFPFAGGLNGDDAFPLDYYEEQFMLDAIAEDTCLECGKYGSDCKCEKDDF